MNLIEVYVHEVTRRLPEKNRDDIALELRSTIEDMLPDDYQEEDVKSALEQLGSPAKLASGYRDWPTHLIGPRYFDIYTTFLKMILPIAAVIAFISVFAEYVIGYDGQDAIINVALELAGFGIWRMIDVGMQTFFWFTVVFAVIERMDKDKSNEPLTTSLKRWTPDDLKNIAYVPKKKAISKVEVFGGLMWTAIWATVYFYANHLVGIYHGGGGTLEFIMPALNQDVLLSFWPIVIFVICLEILLSIYKLIEGQWTKGLAIFNAAFQFISAIVFIIILMNPDLIAENFISYMTDLFKITANQLNSWIVGVAIFAYMLSAIIAIYDGFHKARIR
ncbi:MAG TPA: hypothetical protein VNR38_18030 [Ureibacillus sp.]|nr:hypothetical protein [Ureibacillus sp.]